MKKCINANCPSYFKDYFHFNREVVPRITRQSGQIHFPKVRTEFAKRSFYYNGCAIFNKLMTNQSSCFYLEHLLYITFKLLSCYIYFILILNFVTFNSYIDIGLLLISV